MALFVWYPGCTGCKRARAWLTAHQIPFTERHIREENPTADELRAWRQLSGLPLKRFFNTSGLAYRALDLKERLPALSEEAQLALLAEDGMLVRRPLLIGGGFVPVGFREAEWEARLG